MGLFDRFTSQKGKDDKKTTPGSKPAKPTVAEKQKQAFKAVPKGEEPKTTSDKSKSAPAKPIKENTDQAYRILDRAVVTEKSTRLNRINQYVFAIAPSANKTDVAQAVEQVYGVRPAAVNIVNLPAKPVRYGRFQGRTVRRRKAIVTLPAGKTIDQVNA